MNIDKSRFEVDMHTHSRFSDGNASPENLVERIMARNLQACVLTDHNTCWGTERFLSAAANAGLDTITGIEVGSSYKGRDVHILGYGINPEIMDQSEELLISNTCQNERARAMLTKYAELGVMNASFDEVIASEEVNSPYLSIYWIARFRAKKGGISVKEALKEAERGGIVRVDPPTEYLISPIDAVRAIREAGGVAFVAHPGEFSRRLNKGIDPGNTEEFFYELLDLLQAEGLTGVEARYSKHTPEQTLNYERIARDRGLMVCGGSDYHGDLSGEQKPDIHLGDAGVSYEEFLTIKNTCQKVV